MSRQNKVNPGQYTAAGRLTPDDLGREMRRQQAKVAGAPRGAAARPAWETTPPAPAATRPPAQGRGPWTGQGRRRARRDRRDAGGGRCGEGGQPCGGQGHRRAVQEDGRRCAAAWTDGAKRRRTLGKGKGEAAGDGGEAARQQRTLTVGAQRGAKRRARVQSRRSGQRARHAQVAVVGHRRRDDVGGRGRARRVVRSARRVGVARPFRRLAEPAGGGSAPRARSPTTTAGRGAPVRLARPDCHGPAYTTRGSRRAA